MTGYVNLPTVVIVLIPWRQHVVLIRRNLPEGFGKLALPGGFQEGAQRHTLHQTAVKEVAEEVGLIISESDLSVVYACTDELGHNLIFFEHTGQQFEEIEDLSKLFSHDAEVQEVVLTRWVVDTAFPIHTAVLRDYLRVLKHRHARQNPVQLVGS